MHFTDKLLDLLDTIGATKSKTEKLALVKKMNEYDRRVVQLALDPTVTFGVAKVEMPKTYAAQRTEWEHTEFELLQRLAERALTGNEALEQIHFTLKELTPKSAELLKRVLLKDLRAGIGAGIVNKAFPGLIPEFPYMRCSLPKDSDMDKWDWSQGVFSQLKADGSFARVIFTDDEEVKISTRQGNVYPSGALASIEESVRSQVKPGNELHGELLVYKNGESKPMLRADGNGILNSLMQGGAIPEGHHVRLSAWDTIPCVAAVVDGKYTQPYRLRLETLKAMIGGSGILNIVETRVVFSKAEAQLHCAEKLAEGLEGTVCKHPEAIWADGDSKDQVKFKLEVDVDLKIVGFNPGEQGKKTEKTFGSLICRSSDELLEVGVSGMKDAVREHIHQNREAMIGKVVTVKANGVCEPSGEAKIFSLFSPRFVEIRPDKVEADSLERVRAQFAAAVELPT